MIYSEEFKEKVLYAFNDIVLSEIGMDKEEFKESLECEDPFIGRIIDTARFQNISTSKATLDELYNEWEEIFFNPQNEEWAKSHVNQKRLEKILNQNQTN